MAHLGYISNLFLLQLGYLFVTRIIAQEARVIQATDVK